MALSGNQITNVGIIGFPGRAYAGFVAKAESVPVADLTFGILSFIASQGQGVVAAISQDGKGVIATISQSSGVLSIISNQGKGVESTISDRGIGVEDKL